MKLLLDTCVWGKACQELEEAGHDVIWSGNWPEDPGDDEILAYAYREGRTLVTLDKDFGELAVVHGRPHTGIIRLVGLSAREQAAVCLHVIERYAEELEAGAIVTVGPGWARIRPSSA